MTQGFASYDCAKHPFCITFFVCKGICWRWVAGVNISFTSIRRLKVWADTFFLVLLSWHSMRCSESSVRLFCTVGFRDLLNRSLISAMSLCYEVFSFFACSNRTNLLFLSFHTAKVWPHRGKQTAARKGVSRWFLPSAARRSYNSSFIQ